MTVDQLVRPRFMSVPESVGTYGDEAADLSELYGKPLFPEQRLAVDALMTYRAGGKWATLERALVQPRQNGKSAAVLQAVVMADMFLFKADRVVWTAHLFKTARDAFLEVQKAIEGTPELSRRVKQVFASSQDFSVHLHSGARLEFLARSKGGGRGLGGKTVVMDEALYLSADQIGALMPTLSARENPHLLYGSSAGLLESDQLRRLRERGRKGDDPSLTYLEWSAEEGCDAEGCTHEIDTPGCRLDDRDAWRQANPMLGRFITEDYVASERRGMPPEQFATERLGWWRDPVDNVDGLSMEEWAACADTRAAPSDPVVVAVEVAPYGTSASIVVCGSDARDPDEPLPVLEVVRSDKRLGWVAETLQAMRSELGEFEPVLDPSSRAGALIPDLEAAGFTVDLMNGRDVTGACGAFTTALPERRVLHRDESALNASVAGARVRPVGDAFRLSRRDMTVDPSPVVAAAFAYFRWLSKFGVDYDVMASFY